MLEERNEHIINYINKSTTKANAKYKGLISDETIEKGIEQFTSSDYESYSEEEIFKEIDKIIKEMIEAKELKMKKLKDLKPEVNNDNIIQINIEPRPTPLDEIIEEEPEELLETKENELTTMIESSEETQIESKTKETKNQDKAKHKVLTKNPSGNTESNNSDGFVNIMYVIGMMGVSFVLVASIVSLLLKI